MEESLILYPFLLILTLYKFWIYSRKDGFDLEKSFDMIFTSAVFGFLLQFGLHAFTLKSVNVAGLLQKFNFGLFVYSLTLGCLFFCLRFRWSVYRVLDNLSLSLNLSFILWFIYQLLFFGFNLFYFVWVLALSLAHFVLSKYRIVLLKSGFTFSFLFFTYGVFCLLTKENLADLIFAFLLFKLSIVVLIFRLKYLWQK